MEYIVVVQEVHGDVIMVAIGYQWKSLGTIFCENISLNNYHRSFILLDFMMGLRLVVSMCTEF